MGRKNSNEPIHMVKVEAGWFDGKKTIPFNELSDDYLQNAKIHAQKKELHYFNRAGLFNELTELLEAEAETRGIELTDYDTEYHKNRRMFKNKMKVSKEEP
jgi:hypothetical protein